jgi:DNA-binding response OmpR family regulator
MGDVRLIHEVLAQHAIDAEVTLHRDGEEMLRHIDRIEAGEAPCPDVLLLDLNLPRHNGEAVLARMRVGAHCGNVPVIVVTSSNALKDRETAARLGATKYFHKAADFDEFMRLGDVIREVVGKRTAN